MPVLDEIERDSKTKVGWIRAAEMKRPKIEGPFWVILVFGRA